MNQSGPKEGAVGEGTDHEYAILGTNSINCHPQKLFIALMNFFSIVLLCALLTWLLRGEVGPAVLGDLYARLDGA